MRSPKTFITIIFCLAFFFALFDLPYGLKIGNVAISPSNIHIRSALVSIAKDFTYKLGLDLQGGTKITYKVDMSRVARPERDAAFEGARNVIERRVNFFGVSEPSIQTLKLPNDYRIVVELPGATNVNQAVDLIGKTAQLTFWEAGVLAPDEATPEAPLFPLGMQQILGPKPLKTDLTGKDLKSAKVVFDQNTGAPQVQLTFTSRGAQIFGDITRRNVGKIVAIALDNQVVQAPRVQQEILNGNAVITGGFTTEQAKNVSIALNAGALPAPLHIIAQSTVGPSLGIDSLKASLFAGVAGFFSIIIFMSYLYRKEGMLASVALIIYTAVTLFIFKFFGITLTLAGIAGFILSVGMAVDANILIFERMREELRSGKTREAAQRLGFSRAWSSIRDSNISSLITSFILFYFGTGSVRGFALTLAIGILVSMFSAVMVTRNLLAVFDKNN